MTQGRVLIIAGSDSGGGAGIQADIKTVTALGGYAMTAVTAITVQDTTGVHGVHPIPLDVIRDQIRVVLEDIGADAIKTGMLGTAETVHAVADAVAAFAPGTPLVVDPVMVAKGGHALLEDAAVAAVRDRLLPMAAVVTPNAPEAERLTGLAVRTADGLAAAGRALVGLGARAALVKGGHLAGPEIVDVLVAADGETRFADPRIDTRHTHGTGCTLASGIAVRLAQGADLNTSVTDSRAYLRIAIARAPGFGRGHGPIDHSWPVKDRKP